MDEPRQNIEGNDNIQIYGNGNTVSFDRPRTLQRHPSKCNIQVYRLMYGPIDAAFAISTAILIVLLHCTLPYCLLIAVVVFSTWYLLPWKFNSFFLMMYVPNKYLSIRGIEYPIEDLRKVTWDKRNRLWVYFWDRDAPIALSFYSPYHAEYLFDCIFSSYAS